MGWAADMLKISSRKKVMRFSSFVAACAALYAHAGLGAVVLKQGGNLHVDVESEPVSSATLFFVDDVPVLHWGEASYRPQMGANSLYDDAPVAAYAVYDRSAHNATGWGKLWITTTRDVPMLDSMYAAGYLEGALTHDTMWYFYQNEKWDWFKEDDVPTGLLEWLEENLDWTRRNARELHLHESPESRAFWGSISLTLSQLDGLVAGYNAHCPPERRLSTAEILLLSADGDLETLVPVFTKKDESGKANGKTGGRSNRRLGTARCSALVKFLDDKSDIFVGHATFDHYSLMLRTLKTYNITLDCSPDHAVLNKCHQYQRSITFSSSPGFLWSLDDWYITSNGLVVMETTNTDYTEQHIEGLVVNSVLSWMRGMAANWLAETPGEWAHIFSMHNSGTYNSQWMVLDHKRFTKGEPLPPGSFYVLEQASTFVEVMDATSHLNEQGYWASYNVPFFPSVYVASGFDEMRAHQGNEFSYYDAPRARIFREEEMYVKDMESFKRVMRLNNYLSNPLSGGEPGNAIAGRSDLSPNPAKFQLDGAIDAKVVNMEMAARMVFDAVNGPTHDNLPPFSWAEYPDVAHHGMPQVFNFTWTSFGADPPKPKN